MTPTRAVTFHAKPSVLFSWLLFLCLLLDLLGTVQALTCRSHESIEQSQLDYYASSELCSRKARGMPEPRAATVVEDIQAVAVCQESSKYTLFLGLCPEWRVDDFHSGNARHRASSSSVLNYFSYLTKVETVFPLFVNPQGRRDSNQGASNKRMLMDCLVWHF